MCRNNVWGRVYKPSQSTPTGYVIERTSYSKGKVSGGDKKTSQQGSPREIHVNETQDNQYAYSCQKSSDCKKWIAFCSKDHANCFHFVPKENADVRLSLLPMSARVFVSSCGTALLIECWWHVPELSESRAVWLRMKRTSFRSVMNVKYLDVIWQFMNVRLSHNWTLNRLQMFQNVSNLIGVNNKYKCGPSCNTEKSYEKIKQ